MLPEKRPAEKLSSDCFLPRGDHIIPPLEKNTRICQQLLELSPKFVELPPSRSGKHLFLKFLYLHRDPDQH